MAIREERTVTSISGSFNEDGTLQSACKSYCVKVINDDTDEVLTIYGDSVYYNTKEEFLEAIGVSS